MSIKQTTFYAANLTLPPLAQANFIVYIPRIYNSPIVVESATLPSETFSEVVVYNRGTAVSMPGKPEGPHTWTCTLYDNIVGSSAIQANLLQAHQLVPKYPSLAEIAAAIATGGSVGKSPWSPIDILVFPLAGFLDIPIPNGVIGKKLTGAWLQKIDPISFNTGSVEAVKLQLTFKFTSAKSTNSNLFMGATALAAIYSTIMSNV